MPPIYEVTLSSRAEQDLLNIYDAICEIATPYNAERTVLSILARTNSLSIFPTRGQLVFEEDEIRTIKAGNYRIFFTLDHEQRVVYIVRFSTKGCDFSKLLK